MKILLNGQLTRQSEAVISAFDHGFLYGMGLFETFRTYGGRPWLLERHADRLSRGCEQLGIRYEPDVGRMKRRIAELLEANGLGDGYVRWSVSAGVGEIGLPSADYERPNEIVYAKPLAPDKPETRQGKPLRLLQLRRSTPEGAFRLKSFHYMNNIAAKRELRLTGAAPNTEGLFLDGAGHVAEGMVSNVFWARSGKLYTPSPDTGLLEGVTREYVIRMAIAEGLSVEEGLYGWESLQEADEAFVTNSIQEIVPVARLEDDQGRPARPAYERAGEITSRLMRLYRNAAERSETE
ncbi:aminodeoxychorismate lyase [Cohnella hongkongensis]|uniref:Aminodeoxychorismate lyase n=1 Tax=Cohnella hongkongensis TaxID=178337 RepID=A0ABV9FHV3_9BACL